MLSVKYVDLSVFLIYLNVVLNELPSVLSHCWFGVRKVIHNRKKIPLEQSSKISLETFWKANRLLPNKSSATAVMADRCQKAGPNSNCQVTATRQPNFLKFSLFRTHWLQQSRTGSACSEHVNIARTELNWTGVTVLNKFSSVQLQFSSWDVNERLHNYIRHCRR